MRVQWLLVLASVGCSVEAGKIPDGSITRPPKIIDLTRGEIQSTLGKLHASVAMVNRLESVIQRGLEERDVDMGPPTGTAHLLAPSEGDTLTFDSNHPEKFKYRFNNSASFHMRTLSGGKVEIALAGTLDAREERVAIKDAKLDVIHEKPDGTRVFHIIYEKSNTDSGERQTEWSMDLRQLSELYQDMGGEDEGIATLQGFLEFRISTSQTHMTAKDFALIRDDISVVFEEIEVHLVHGASSQNGVKAKGHVDQGGVRRGQFSVARVAHGTSTALELSIDVK